MIRSVKGAATRQFIMSGKSKFSGMDKEVVKQRIAELNATKILDDLGHLDSTGFHKLKAPLTDFWSVDINGRLRLFFRFERGDAFEVHIDDTH
jgi:proteic killer suppression protein